MDNLLFLDNINCEKTKSDCPLAKLPICGEKIGKGWSGGHVCNLEKGHSGKHKCGSYDCKFEW